MATIETWLTDGRNYFEGLQILRDHGASEFMIGLLEDGPDEYNTPKLHAEILALHKKDEAVISYSPNPDLEKTLRYKEQIRQLFKEISHLKGQLINLPEGPKLYECARLIVTKDLRKQDLWEHLHYFETNGVWFDDLPENKPKPFNLERQIKNVMANRSKAAGYLKQPQPVAKKLHYEQKIAAFNKELETLIKQR
jgi:hypothetical protein